MRTCPAPGLGISRSMTWKSPPGLVICATFIVAIATCVVAMVVSPLNSSRDFENDFQLDRRAKRETRDAIDEAARVSFFAEDVLQQGRRTVGDLGLIANISRRGDRDAQSNDARDPVEGSEVLTRNRERIQRGKPRRLRGCGNVEFRADTADKRRRTAVGGKHAAQKQQVA